MHAVDTSADTRRLTTDDFSDVVPGGAAASDEHFVLEELDESAGIPGAGLVWGVIFGGALWAVIAMILVVLL